MSGRLLILGCGYTGLEIARQAIAAGWTVSGTARRPASLAEVAAAGARPVVLETDKRLLADAVATADAIVCSIPAEADGDPSWPLLAPLLAARSALPVVYLSTTAVYGDRSGGWAHEDDPPSPASPRAEARVLAERQWQSLASPAMIARLPGIYGPGRSQIDKILAGEARSIDKPGQIFSRCHRDDIASGVLAAVRHGRPGAMFNLCDDRPCPAPEVNDFAAGLLGLPPLPRIPFAEAALSPMARQFYGDSKRVSNARAKAALGWRLCYPSYREGLAAIHAGGDAKPQLS
jgi:nucleoside-diphosphate-sugar epimerase